jgi:hypothetical protein
MREEIKKMWETRPLLLIILVGLFFRALAVVFSKGFGMFDDHFLVIEASQAWADGTDYNYWLPSSGATSPDGHSLFYSGLHFLLFKYLKWRGLMDPQAKMYIVRALHALWSLLIIIYGYKITNHYAGKNVARQAGMILSILWFMPMLAVRNLIEITCIPPLMIATWLLVNPLTKEKVRSYVWAGILCGIAFNIRFQSLLFIGGIGLVLLFQKRWKQSIVFGLLFFLAVFSVQGLVDMYIWKKPFAELTEYVRYNFANANTYTTGAWYQYIGTVAGTLLPPISLFLMFGFMRSWKKYPLLFWPSFLFFVFHSMFPNKQERFIAPIIPFIIVLGSIGWSEFVTRSKYWLNHKKLLRGCWTFFWVVNCIMLPFLSTMYSKKSRVESMTYLYKQADVQNIIIEDSDEDDYIQPPLYYIGSWKVHVVGVTQKYSLYKAYKVFKNANYIIFFGKDHIDERIAYFQKMFPDNEYKATITPSLIDNVFEFLNPINKNQSAFIYKFNENIMQIPKDSLILH